jgi:hypothetical protein
MNVVSPGISTSQILMVLPAALTLLVVATLLWMNHRALVPATLPTAALLPCIGLLSPADPIFGSLLVIPAATPARAPPDFPSPCILQSPPGTCPALLLRDIGLRQ